MLSTHLLVMYLLTRIDCLLNSFIIIVDMVLIDNNFRHNLLFTNQVNRVSKIIYKTIDMVKWGKKLNQGPA